MSKTGTLFSGSTGAIVDIVPYTDPAPTPATFAVVPYSQARAPVYMNDYDISITRKDGSVIKVAETLELILEKLSIILENQEKNEKYPALKEAYMNYKLVEKMLTGDSDE